MGEEANIWAEVVGERENSAEEEGVMSHDVAGEALGEAGAEEEDEEGEGDIPSSRSRSPDQMPLEMARVLEGSLQGVATVLWTRALASASSKGRTGAALAGRRRLGSSPQSAPSAGAGSIARSGRALLAREMEGSIEIGKSREILDAESCMRFQGCTPTGGRRRGDAKEGGRGGRSWGEKKGEDSEQGFSITLFAKEKVREPGERVVTLKPVFCVERDSRSFTQSSNHISRRVI